jgi:hypothetical protein
MAKCARCGKDTSLYFQGTPICVECDDRLSSKAGVKKDQVCENDQSNDEKAKGAKTLTPC